MNKSLPRSFLIVIAGSAVLFSLLFWRQNIGALDFWWWMAANNAMLTGSAFALTGELRQEMRRDFAENRLNKLLLGLAAAGLLYFVFFAGNILSRTLFGFAEEQISAVYMLRSNAAAARIAVLLLLIIGPGEELLWRGYVQRQLMTLSGPISGLFLGTLLYTAVHLASGNPMLLLAALVCGLFWGLLYLWQKSLLVNMISHAVWDILVFLVFPFS